MNPSMELLENVLFSIVLNHNPPDSGNVVNSYEFYNHCFNQRADLERDHAALMPVSPIVIVYILH
mgnify:FL=1